MYIEQNGKPTPQEAIEILKKHGIIITLQQAEKVLAFMDLLATIMVEGTKK